ncbi:RagB/SusD family nutrient uptake outer membrane protein [Flavitalea sp.]|nr:RagB/SusD family nutrient uptake outer membrane protein [Flavitalea sp.]
MKIRILIFIMTIGLAGCIKNVLDRKPLNILSDQDVWNSETLITVYLAALYDNIPIGFDKIGAGTVYESHMTDETSHPWAGVTLVNNYGSNGLALNSTMYQWIRKANFFLERVKTSSLTEDQIKTLTAECRFIRAYYYFDLVKKYGGMPIIKDVQIFEGNLNELKVPRNKEVEVYEFILAELNDAVSDLPASRDGANENRATKWAALALKSRAMLYAGSIAKYGSIQLDGLVGIPGNNATKYFTESKNASQAIIDGNKYGLYDKLYNPIAKTGDPSANYQNIFLDEGNKEVIFQKAYSNPDKRHSFDNTNMPNSYKTGCCGNASSPTLEMVESFEYIDGTPGTLAIGGGTKEFNHPDELFKDKDPRFNASVLRPESPFNGRPVQIYRGVTDTDGTLFQNFSTPFPKDPAVSQVGRDGPVSLGDIGKTGFYLKKYLITSTIIAEGRSDQNYIDFRYAEILLNYAEAEFELGTNMQKALDATNQIRNRAGIKILTLAELTKDRLRNERKVELAFEDKRFWDLRRWRIGPSLFTNTRIHGLWPYLSYKGAGVYKWTFKRVEGSPLDNGQVRTFAERDYYSNLSDYIITNANIVNNPGW